MKKNFLVAVAVILLICVFVGIFFLLSKNKTFPVALPNLSQSPQKLKVIEPGVTLTRNNQTTDLAKGSETSLNVGDKVVTNNTGVAIISYSEEGTNVKLSSNTNVTFDGGTNLIQEIGKVYVRFKKVLGGSEDFSVETPTMVATVRGTAFASIIKKDLDPKIIVTEHEVEVTQKDEATGKRLATKQLVKMGEQLEFIRSRKQFRLGKLVLTSEEEQWIEENGGATPVPSTPTPVSTISATIKPTTIATVSATPSYSSFTQMPGAGYHRGNVVTAVGNFILSCIGSAKGSTHVLTDSGNDSD